MPKKLGFTLIELMIVITIIAILAAIGFTTYSTFVKSARDSRRQSDLKLIQSALEQYHSDQKYYPASSPLPLTFGSSLTSSTGNPASPLPSPVKTYLNQIPTDPTNNSSYLYKYVSTTSDGNSCDNSSTNCVKYCLFATLEVASQVDLSSCSDPGYTTHQLEVTSP